MTLALAATAVGASFAAGPARATDDELTPSQDNGRDGRNSFRDAGHVPPVEACREPLSDTPRSLVLRRLPRGPVAPDGTTLAFQSGVCIYLPPGYLSSGLRYPVLYLLHGGGGDQAAWVTFGHIRQTMDARVARNSADAAIVVMPDGQDAQWYDSYDRTTLNERYVLDHLIPYVDRHFRTISERSGRAIAGLSNGGYGAMHLAAKAPDRFVAAGSMSGNLGARSMGGLGTPVAPGGPAFQEAGAHYQGNVPIALASNLDGIDLVVDWGARCSSDASVDLCATWGFEQAFGTDNRAFRDRLFDVGHKGVLDYREAEGSHAWRWWSAWMRDRHLPFLLERTTDPRAVGEPAVADLPRLRFRYRSIAPSFSVWGYDVKVVRDVSEFLDLADVDATGMVVRGSGLAVVRTAPRYVPGASYVVQGTGRAGAALAADGRGRLTITVDLGPSHRFEETTPQARAAAAAEGSRHWVQRDVAISPA